MNSNDIRRAVEQRWNSLTKPPGSLGRLEEAITRLAIQQGTPNPSLDRKAIYLFCGDHGITAEGVSAYPGEVTRQMMLNFVHGGAAISVLCRRMNIRTVIVDAGVKGEPVEGTLNHRIGEGTRNFALEPAMTREQAQRALDAGAAIAHANSEDIRAAGEMGIGNTTSASALLCVLTGADPFDAAGPGTGLAPDGVRRKAETIARAIAFHKPDPSDPIGVLAQFGGFEIAMMTGLLIASARQRIPVMMDGFISCSAALVAQAIEPAAAGNLIYSHQSAEPAHARMLTALGAQPLFDLAMRLGEGTGAALGISLLEHALALYNGMATFAQAAVSGPDAKADG
ncbi:MAG: nicotinate-nucleotide--dimethylbenzimidazole phosphoribosyltransferase [Bryobacteraceae bacterium]|nr:nicotinate-nucleotide--dimethylbenzimidazole phosphoribosyltransferase [Bryobacteraceae bacterium]